ASGTRTSSPSTSESVIWSVNSSNWVARTSVYGRPDAVMIFSWATLARTERVRQPRRVVDLLLGDLGAQLAAARKPIGSDDRQGDVVTDPGLRGFRHQVGGRRGEEVHHRTVREIRRVEHVDHGVCARQRISESLAGEHVDAGAPGCGHDVVAFG